MYAQTRIEQLAEQSALGDDYWDVADIAYPDWRDCTGDDDSCRCAWHRWRREEDGSPPLDPYGTDQAMKEQDAHIERLIDEAIAGE